MQSRQALSEITAEGLLTRVAAGEDSALEELYRRQQRSVFAFALQFLSNESDAEDVVVETFHEVWRHAGRFAGESKATTWILGIARHKALDKVRARNHVLMDSDYWNMVAETVPGPGESAADAMARESDAAELRRHLARLPVEQRECIQLVFFNELALSEVAAIQGVPENTVKTRLFHARRKLREWIESAEGGPVRMGALQIV
ncbi:MAG: sigma-70 family RNA polymerase sigma factor [Betaproteobacteria bacterium]|nr:sigma-70 family RNA polymerase sigma factor [Betaproteobacteria bacterium]